MINKQAATKTNRMTAAREEANQARHPELFCTRRRTATQAAASQMTNMVRAKSFTAYISPQRNPAFEKPFTLQVRFPACNG
jgi:hypothetical protein